MNHKFVSSIPFPEFSIWDKLGETRPLKSFEIELTARCNNNCRHCYINLAPNDSMAKKRELSVEDISKIADEAVSLGALWCLVTGGEPLLRQDFFDIYLNLKKKGLLVSVFTNATLITEKHVSLFKKYPPRDIEVSVYGVTQKTYDRVTRRPGSFIAFRRGLDLLLENEIKVHLKAMALRSNFHELNEISHFCRERTKDYFRFDPFLHLRYDGNIIRNSEIISERLTPSEIVASEKSDLNRFQALKKSCDKLIIPEFADSNCNHLFRCGAGLESCSLSYDGILHLCSSLWHPDCTYDLRKGGLSEAWHSFFPKVREMRSERRDYLSKCRVCPIINLCMFCPAQAHLETGKMDEPVDYFCRVAHARAEAIKADKELDKGRNCIT